MTSIELDERTFEAKLQNLTNLEVLSLSEVNISSPIPVNISSSLRYLDLRHTNLLGVLTESFFLLPNSLETLKLSDNHLLKGVFPKTHRSNTLLMELDISFTSISGSIPDSIGNLTQITELILSYNHFTGHIPSTISKLKHLTYLDLYSNSFSGEIPDRHEVVLVAVPHCLGSMANLMVSDLRKNNFTGSLPPLCAHNTSLSTIVVNGNLFEGPVPVSLLKCDSLEVLDVGNNVINDTFPSWLGTLEYLQVLLLKSNKFHGPISTCQTKFCFPKLRIFDLSRNDFSGSLSAKVFGNFKAMIKLDGEDTGNIKYMESVLNSSFDTSYEDSVSLVIKGQDIELQRISTIMTTIDLSSNHFEGVIPKTLKDLSSLWLLNLSRNNLRGDIPMKLGQLSMLEALDLSWNRLTGKIPQELTRMNFLAFLNLSQNHLVGPIPQGRQFNTFENDSYGGNLHLCGLPLTKKCGTSDSSHVPQQLESEEEGESYFFSGFTWESVVIGYSFGLVVGTVIWSLMFKYRKPKWFVEFFDGLMPHKRRRPKKRAQRRRT
ncbi:receptor-like protein 9DC3 [Solanum stenotomum]|uniref:receptor-like protein 9DC3 n=1 Tax=Solanum stenotomum TaxID=172797 RepID=UPI0020D1E7DF|nr:receptor-like protein 9DC3 [Solanum stenotomum]